MNRLNLQRRHEGHCRYHGKPRSWSRRNPNKCACPIHCDGTLSGKRVRTSLETRAWHDAEATRLLWERSGRIVQRSASNGGKTFSKAFAHFEKEKREVDEITDETWRKYKALGEKLEDLLEDRIRYVDEITLEDLDDFVLESSKTQQSSTLAETVRRLKHFIDHCERHDWIRLSLSRKLRIPKVIRKSKPAFTQQAMAAILSHCTDPMDAAFVLFMRYTGFAIEDASNCPKDHLGPLERCELPDGRLVEVARVWTRRAKRGEAAEPVEAWLPRHVVEALEAFPHRSGTHWFKSDRSSRKSAPKTMGARLRKIFKRAGLPDGHSHRFRRTLSTAVLDQGRTMEDAATLLGNTPQIVGRHYAPITPRRLSRAKEAAAMALVDDPLVSTSGTSTAHEGLTRAN